MSAYDGGPAFPSAFTNDGDRNVSAPDRSIVPPGFTVPMQGMSLRDYFAAKAMQGAIGTAAAPYMTPDKACAQAVAAMAYQLADAMLAAREAKP